MLQKEATPAEYELVTMIDGTIKDIRGVNNQEADMILAANETMHKFHNFVRKHAEVEHNYDDYWRTIERYQNLFENDLKGEVIGFDYKEKSFVDINRAYNNYVSSVKSFTELCRHKIKKSFGDSSAEHIEFEKVVSGFYDNSLSYRLIQKTRDFALHSHFSIQQIQFINEDKIEVNVAFDRDMFLANNALRKTLENDIKDFEPFFDVKPFLEEMPQMIQSVLKNFVQISKSKYEEAAKIIMNLEEETGTDKIGLNKPNFSVVGVVTNNTKIIPVYMANKFFELLS